MGVTLLGQYSGSTGTIGLSIFAACDYDGDGTADFAVYRPSTGYWYIKGGPYVRWGIQSGDIPVQADYTGNGKYDIAVYRPSTGYWYIKGGLAVRWGIQPGDIPVTRGEK